MENNNSTNSTKNKNIIKIIFTIFFIILIFLIIIFIKNKKTNSTDTNESSNETTTIKQIDSKENSYQALWQEYYERAYNKDDYIGQIVFDSGIINEPIMQGEDNDYYLRRNFETNKFDICGPVFVDYECKEGDQNLVLYGHDLSTMDDPKGKILFTPLHK